MIMVADAVTASPRWRRASVPQSAGELVCSGISPRLSRLLARRGVTTERQAKAFLAPDLSQLHDPFLLPGVDAAVKRLLAARQGREKTAVVGDYDVDGVSATALLTAVLRACGLQVVPILPERLEEGYGFQPVHVDAAVAEGCGLIITADCGSTAVEAALHARQQGIDVIVTDHHLGSTESLPEGVVEINPQSPGSSYPFADLSGVGVAYKLTMAFTHAVGRTLDDTALLRVVCLGTICDLVPLLGENRVLASKGLEALARPRSAGLRALMGRAGVRPPVNAVDVAYRIGPRLNAAGRLGSPKPALELLLTTDGRQARRLAEDLDQWNRERQAAESVVVEEAEQTFAGMDPLPPILVGWSESWHPGVLGIAAGRLARTFHRPAVLLQVSGGIAKGSGRSVPGVHLFDFLNRWRSDYVRFGGHSQAVGLSISHDHLPDLRDQWHESARESWEPELLTRLIEYELDLAPGEITRELLVEIEKLEPFGMGNRQPIVRVGPLRLAGEIRRFGRGHLATRALGDSGGEVELLGWGWQEREGDLEGRFEVVATIERDRYQEGPVLRLIDARPRVDPADGSKTEDSGPRA